MKMRRSRRRRDDADGATQLPTGRRRGRAECLRQRQRRTRLVPSCHRKGIVAPEELVQLAVRLHSLRQTKENTSRLCQGC